MSDVCYKRLSIEQRNWEQKVIHQKFRLSIMKMKVVYHENISSIVTKILINRLKTILAENANWNCKMLQSLTSYLGNWNHTFTNHKYLSKR